ECAEDAVNHYTFWNLLSCQRMMRALGIGALVNGGDLSRFRGALNKEYGCQDHPDFHRHGQIDNNREKKSRQEYQRIASRPFQKTSKIVPLAHMQGHVHQHRAEGGEWN